MPMASKKTPRAPAPSSLQACSHVTKYGPNGEIIDLTDEEIADASRHQAVAHFW
jgi:hypothetical protein